MNLSPEGNHQAVVTAATGSVKWSFAANIAPRLITPIATAIVAAVLTPEDFGLIAISNLVVALAQTMIQPALGPAIIQRKTDVQLAASVIFWLGLLVGLAIYLVILGLAPLLATAYEMPELVQVLPISGISLILSTLTSIPIALFQREMAFKRIFWVTSLPMIISSVAAIICVMLGAGFWALVIGPLIGQVLNVIVVWFVSSWRPVWSFDFRIMNQLLVFSTWLVIQGFQTWLFLYADNAIAGLYLNARELGYYSLGYNLSVIIPGMISASLSTVAYSAFCQLQDTPERIGQSLLRLQSMAATVMFPACLGLSAVAVFAIQLIYGEKWLMMGTVMQWLVVMPGLGTLWSLNSDAYRAIGRPGLWPRRMFLVLLILLPALFLAGPLGLIPFTIVRFVGGLLVPIIHIVLTRAVFGVSWRQYVKALLSPFLASVIMAWIASSLLQAWTPRTRLLDALVLGVTILISTASYVAILWLIDRTLLQEIIGFGRRVLWERAAKKTTPKHLEKIN